MSLEDELCDAVESGSKLAVDLLLGLKVYVNAQNKEGYTPLHLAIIHENYEIITQLLKAGAQVNVQNPYNGYTPLHTAILINNIPMVNTLLSLCSNPSVADTKGNFPIHLAAEGGCTDIINDLPLDKNTINAKNHNGFTPLHLAVQNGHEKAVEMLICGGADLDIQDGSEKGDTALMIAAKGDHISIVKLLLGRGADYNKSNNAGKTFGVFATSEEMINIVSKYDKFKDFSIPSTSGLSSRKRKTLSNISNTSSSSSSDRSHICKTINGISDVTVPCATNYSMHENKELAGLSIIPSLIGKRRRPSYMSDSSSSYSNDKTHSSKRGKGNDESFLVYRYKLDSSTTTSSSISRCSSPDAIDISPPGSDISEPLASGCKNTLQALNLHYSAPSSPERSRL